MAVKNYDQNALVQRMVDLYVDTIRYHGGHWQALNGHYNHYGSSGTNPWVTVADDTLFITHLYNELRNDLLAMEIKHPALAASIATISLSSFISAAQTQFTA